MRTWRLNTEATIRATPEYFRRRGDDRCIQHDIGNRGFDRARAGVRTRERHALRRRDRMTGHFRCDHGEANRPAPGRAGRRRSREGRCRYPRAAGERAIASLGNTDARSSACRTAADDRLWRHRVPTVDTTRGHTGIRALPEIGGGSCRIAEEGFGTGIERQPSGSDVFIAAQGCTRQLPDCIAVTCCNALWLIA